MSNRKGPGRKGNHYARRRNPPGSKIVKRHCREAWLSATRRVPLLGLYVSTPRKGERIVADDGRLVRAGA